MTNDRGCPAFPGNDYAPKEWCVRNRHNDLCRGRCKRYRGDIPKSIYQFEREKESAQEAA